MTSTLSKTKQACLRVIPLGGLHEIGKNTCVFEYGDDLMLVVMSATLDAAPVAAVMQAPIVTSEGRSFPVDLRWLDRPVGKQRFDQAIADYDHAIKMNPKDPAAFFNRGNVYQAQQQFDKAIADFSQAIKLYPEDHRAFLNRGGLFYDLKKYPEAIADYTKAKQLSPENALISYNLACLQALSHQPAKVWPNLRRAFELDSNKRLLNYAKDDKELANVADMPEFKSLISEFDKK